MTMLPLEVFYNKNYIANILSFSAVARKFRIIINTDLYPDINMHLDEGTSILIKKCIGWLNFYDRTKMKHYIINIQVTD